MWNGETYYSCTNKTARFGNGEFSYGNPWCSTKTDPITNEHVANRRFHGDCKTEFCPSGKKSVNQAIGRSKFEDGLRLGGVGRSFETDHINLWITPVL